MRKLLYGFNSDDAGTLREIAQRTRLSAPGRDRPGLWTPPGNVVGAWIGQATTSITGAAYAANITPGSGTVKLMQRGATYLEAHLPDGTNPTTLTAYSLLPHAVLQNGIVSLLRTLDASIWITAWLDMPQLFCRFTANADFTTSSETVTGTIQSQFGPGRGHTTTSRTFYNLEDNAGGYVFEGDSGDAGFAVWDSGSNWRIIQMECPAYV